MHAVAIRQVNIVVQVQIFLHKPPMFCEALLILKYLIIFISSPRSHDKFSFQQLAFKVLSSESKIKHWYRVRILFRSPARRAFQVISPFDSDNDF